ncbi:MAG: hypothetical protein HY960_00655 [Ignavibacteriae bacterium]|nr:hypothetical protein [Ignavibacteriota bacterium]
MQHIIFVSMRTFMFGLVIMFIGTNSGVWAERQYDADNNLMSENRNIVSQGSRHDDTMDKVGVTTQGIISGIVYNDLNTNAIYDVNEQGLEGWTVNLSGDVNLTTESDVNGNYSFNNLPIGQYLVTVHNREGWTRTPPRRRFTNYINENERTIFTRLQQIRENAYQYYLGSGGRSYLNYTIPGSLTSDSAATYSISAKSTKTFTLLASSVRWTYLRGSITVTIDSNGTIASYTPWGPYYNNAYFIKITSTGQSVTQKNFGYFPFEVRGRVVSSMRDQTGGVSGRTVLLSSPFFTTATSTDTLGYYVFSDIPSGIYSIELVSSEGWTQTVPPESTLASNDSIYNNSFQLMKGIYQIFDNAIYYYLNHATYEGYIIPDSLSGSGNPEGTFSIVSASSLQLKIQATSKRFVEVFQNYTLNQNGQFESNSGSGGATISNGKYVIPFFQDGSHGLKPHYYDEFDRFNYNFAVSQNSSITGVVFYDSTLDGVKEVEENGVYQIPIFITGAENASMVTDSNGNYLFTNILPGSYYVTARTNESWKQTSPSPSVIVHSRDSVLNNFRDVTTWFYRLAHDALLFRIPPSSRGGGEGDYWGYYPNPGLVLPGFATYSVVSRSQFSVSFQATSAYGFGTVTASADSLGRVNFTSVTGDFASLGYYSIATDSAQFSGQHYDFAMINVGTVSGTLFHDANRNAVNDPGELPLFGWTVKLDGLSHHAAVTDEQGNYSIDDLPFGNYLVSEVMKENWFQTYPETSYQNKTWLRSKFEVTAFSRLETIASDARNYFYGVGNHSFVGYQIPVNLSYDSIATYTIRNSQTGSIALKAVNSIPFDFFFFVTYDSTGSLIEYDNNGFTMGTSLVRVTPDSAEITSINFGNKPYEISGMVYHSQYDSVSRLSGRLVHVQGPVDTVLVTDAQGNYSLSDIPSGVYSIAEETNDSLFLVGPPQHNIPRNDTLYEKLWGLTSTLYRITEDATKYYHEHFSYVGYSIPDSLSSFGSSYGTYTIELATSTKIRLWGVSNYDGFPSEMIELEPFGVFSSGSGSTRGFIAGRYIVPFAHVQEHGWKVNWRDGVDQYGYNFYLTPKNTFHGTIYNDENGNGNIEPSEQGIHGGKVFIAGRTIDTVETDVTGNYIAEGVAPGSYVLTSAVDFGWEQTVPERVSYSTRRDSIISNLNQIIFTLHQVAQDAYALWLTPTKASGLEKTYFGYYIHHTTQEGTFYNSNATDATSIPLNGESSRGYGKVVASLDTLGKLVFTSFTGAFDSVGSVVVYTDTLRSTTEYNFGLYQQKFNVISSVIGNGTITPVDTQVVNYGTNIQYLFSPGTGYHFDSLLIDGIAVDSSTSYTFNNVTENHTIRVVFAVNHYTLTVNAEHGTVSKTPDQDLYDAGSIVGLKAIPSTGYHFVGWSGDTTNSADSLTITMNRNKNIIATFAIDTLLITATAGENGSITPSGSVQILYGGSQRFTFTPSLNYHVNSVIVDGSKVDSLEGYTFSNVTEDHIILVTFAVITGSISGLKFHDLNGNGIKDGNDAVLEGWNIHLSGVSSETTQTDAIGRYTFSNVLPGTYTICEENRAGWVRSMPDSCYAITIAAGDTVDTLNFGNYQRGMISGEKIVDMNADSLLNGELGRYNWVIKLYDSATCQLVKRTTTSSQGEFSFQNLEPGTYILEESLEVGWLQTFPRTTTPNVSYRTCGVNSAQRSYHLSVSSGDTIANVDFGNYQYGTITGMKYEDYDADSLISINDIKKSGWVIKLFNQGTCSLVSETVTNATTGYSFSNLLPGTYIVEESLQTSWIQTVPRVGASGVTLTTCDANAGTRAYVVTVTSGTNAIGKDFGNTRYCSISGKKYQDAIADSLITNDSAMNGWTIKLYRLGCTLAERTVTSGNGDFVFDSLLAGTYIVEESLFTGWYQSFPRQGSGIVSPCGQNAGGRVYSFVLHSGENSTGVSFANYQHGNITGVKFHDIDGDSVWDGNEQTLQGRIMYLDLNLNENLDTGEPISQTNGSGEYQFSNLKPGMYYLREVEVSGWIQTTSNPKIVLLHSGESLASLNIGNFQLGSMSGMMFNDRNGNGTKEQNESPLSGWKMYLTKSSPTFRLDSTTTNVNGEFMFDSLKYGEYCLSEEMREGWEFTLLPVCPEIIYSGSNHVNRNFGNRQEETVLCELLNRWNMVSVPVVLSQMDEDSVFPDNASQTFSFSCNAGYVGTDTLSNGVGYWLMFSDTTSNRIISGGIISEDTIDVCAGWNMIGSMSDTVSTVCINTEGTTIETPFFSYQDGYVTSSIIKPCKAYWVKVSSDGKLILRKCD